MSGLVRGYVHTTSRLCILDLLCATGSDRSRSIVASLRLDFLDFGLELAEVSLNRVVSGTVAKEFGDTVVVDLRQ